jgi:hypothetical protein
MAAAAAQDQTLNWFGIQEAVEARLSEPEHH